MSDTINEKSQAEVAELKKDETSKKGNGNEDYKEKLVWLKNSMWCGLR